MSRDAPLDAKMLAELREHRENTMDAPRNYRITDEELDMLLAIADERDKLRLMIEDGYDPVGYLASVEATTRAATETKREQWPCWICDEAITIRHGAKPGTARFRHVEMGEYAHDAVRGPDPVDRRCAECAIPIVPKKAGTVGVAWVASTGIDVPSCDHHPKSKA